jgi:hypothetical protein
MAFRSRFEHLPLKKLQIIFVVANLGAVPNYRDVKHAIERPAHVNKPFPYGLELEALVVSPRQNHSGGIKNAGQNLNWQPRGWGKMRAPPERSLVRQPKPIARYQFLKLVKCLKLSIFHGYSTKKMRQLPS